MGELQVLVLELELVLVLEQEERREQGLQQPLSPALALLAWQRQRGQGPPQPRLQPLPGLLRLELEEVEGLEQVLLVLMRLAAVKQQPQLGLELVEQVLELEQLGVQEPLLLELELASLQVLVLSWPWPRLPLLSMQPMGWQA